MAPVTDQQLKVLAPYLANSKPDHRGEMDMYCPLHPDTNRSASLNINMGAWFCHAGCGGGSVRTLLDQEEMFVAMEGRAAAQSLTVEGLRDSTVETVFRSQENLIADVLRWHRRLLDEPKKMRFLYELRGIEAWTVKKALIGFDGKTFKIPVFSPDRKIWNIRSYDPEAPPDRRKIWSLRGFGRARIYPAGILDRCEPGDTVLFCEGEWDALLALQSGVYAVTRTDGAGKPWHEEWNVGFAGLRVFVCHDADRQGVKGNEVVTGALRDVAESVHLCKLPYKVKRKHGRDITDYLLDADDPGTAIIELMEKAKEIQIDRDSRMWTSGAHRSGQPAPALGSA